MNNPLKKCDELFGEKVIYIPLEVKICELINDNKPKIKIEEVNNILYALKQINEPIMDPEYVDLIKEYTEWVKKNE